jgi:hypothetical protein
VGHDRGALVFGEIGYSQVEGAVSQRPATNFVPWLHGS